MGHTRGSPAATIRAALHGGTILPVGDEPDGWTWTGFLSLSKDASAGYAILFRELNASDVFKLDFSDVLPAGKAFRKAEIIGGRGKAELEKGGRALEVEVPAKLDFVWVKLS